MTWIDDEEKAEIADERDVAQERLTACRNLIRDQADSLRDEVGQRVKLQKQINAVLALHRPFSFQVARFDLDPECVYCGFKYPCETAIAAGAKP